MTTGAHTGPDTVELRMRARAENLALARLALGGIALKLGLSEELTSDLRLAVTEACTNAIQHAYPESEAGDREVVVRFVVRTDSLLVVVEDSGGGFDDVDEPREESSEDGVEHGMGLRIIRALTDELEITTGSSGSRILFVRRFSAVS
jgi:serine/threonine-protein kinase RsbW